VFGASCAALLWPWIHSKFGANSNSGVDVLLTIAAGILSFFVSALPLAVIGSVGLSRRHARQYSEFQRETKTAPSRSGVAANVGRLVEFWNRHRLTPGQGVLARVEEVSDFEKQCGQPIPRIFILEQLHFRKGPVLYREILKRYDDSFRVYTFGELAGMKTVVFVAIWIAAFAGIALGVNQVIGTALCIAIVCGALLLLNAIHLWNLGRMHDGTFRWKLAVHLWAVGVKEDGFGGLTNLVLGSGGTWIVRSERPMLEHRSRSGRVLIKHEIDPLRTLVLIDKVGRRNSERARWIFVFPENERYFAYDLNPVGTPWQSVTDADKSVAVQV